MSLSEENHKFHLCLGFCTWTDHLGHFEVSANLLSPAKTQMHNFKSPWVFGSAAVKQGMSWSWLLTWAPLSLSHPFSTHVWHLWRTLHCSREHSSTFLPHPQAPHLQFFLLQAAFVLIAAAPLLQQSEGLRCPFSWLVPLLWLCSSLYVSGRQKQRKQNLL